MTMDAHVPAELRHAPFRGSDMVRRGLLTKRQLDSRVWRRLWRDVYIHTDRAVDEETRLRALALVLPRDAVASGVTAAMLHGVHLAGRLSAVLEVTVQRDNPLSPRPGVRIRHAELAEEDVTLLGGLLVTTPLRTAFDLARLGPGWADPRRERPPRGDLTEHVAAVDALTGAGLCTLRELADYAARDRFAGWFGVRRAVTAAGLAEPLSGSAQESRLRMDFAHGGLPRPVVQHPLRRPDGGRTARLDLAFPYYLVAAEHDGECHARPCLMGAVRHERHVQCRAGEAEEGGRVDPLPTDENAVSAALE